MTGFTQAALSPAPPPEDVSKVPIPRTTLIAHGKRLIAEGRKQAGNAVLTGCIGQGEMVMVSRALADRWKLTEVPRGN